MESLLMEVARDADLHSISCPTESSGETVVGLGYLPGRAIMAVGELALRGMGDVNIWIRLRTIGNQIRSASETIPPQVIKDLLELQRVGLYSDAVRSKAWALILWCLHAPDTLTQMIIRVVLGWPVVEVQLFLRQLAIHRLYGWVSVSETFLILPPFWKNCISRSFRSIFHAVLNKDPAIVREILGLPEFAALQTEVIVHNPEEDTTHSLSHFFNALVDYYHLALFHDVPPPAVAELAYYLCFSPLSELKSVVDHALAIVSSYAHPYSASDLRKTVADHPALARNDLIHPTLPILLFIRHFSEEGEDAIRLFVESGIVDIIGDLCANNFPDPGREPIVEREYVSSSLRLTSCMLLAHIYVVFPGCVRHLRLTNPTGFFDIFPWMMDYCYSSQSSDSVVINPDIHQLRNTFYEELFDLFFLPAAVVGTQAREWVCDMVLSQIVRQRELVIIRNLMKRSSSQSTRLLRQLIRWRKSNWTSHPRTTPLLVDYSDHLLLNSSFAHFLDLVITHDKAILCKAFSVSEFQHFFPQVDSLWDPRNIPSCNALQVYFDSLAGRCNNPNDTPNWSIPNGYKPFLRFISSVESECSPAIINFILTLIRPFSHTHLDPDSILLTYSRYPSLDPKHPIHPVYPFLLFLLAFCEITPFPARLFTSDPEGWEVCEAIHVASVSSDSGSSLSEHSGRPSSEYETYREVLLRHAPQLRPSWMRWVPSSGGKHRNSLDKPFLQAFSVAECRLYVHRSPLEGDLPRLLVDFLSDVSATSLTADSTMGILLCTAVLPGDRWASMISALRGLRPHQLSNVLFNAKLYIESLGSTHKHRSLHQILRVVQADFPNEVAQGIIYSVDRFKELLSNAAQGDDIFLKRLMISGILDVAVPPPLDLPTDVLAQGM